MASFIEIKPDGVSVAAWEIVVEAWENGLSDREAAFRVSKITGKTLKAKDIQEWCRNAEVAELRGNLLNDLLSSAKLTIADSLRSGDIKTAKWYAERKGAEEFSTKSAVAFENAVVTLSLEDKEEALKQRMDEFFSDNGE